MPRTSNARGAVPNSRRSLERLLPACSPSKSPAPSSAPHNAPFATGANAASDPAGHGSGRHYITVAEARRFLTSAQPAGSNEPRDVRRG